MLENWLNITQQNWTFWIAGLFALFEFFKTGVKAWDWIFERFKIETKGMRSRREDKERIRKTEKAIEEIKETTKRNGEMFDNHEQQALDRFAEIKTEIIDELVKLHDKIDGQAVVIEENRKESIKTDCVMLRDRLNGGMKYFSQNKDENGNVHIKLSDYETMNGLFEEYFSKGGNGPFQKMYEEEFVHFIIDR